MESPQIRNQSIPCIFFLVPKPETTVEERRRERWKEEYVITNSCLDIRQEWAGRSLNMTACSTVFGTKFINVQLAKNSSFYGTRNFTVLFSSLGCILGQIYNLGTSIRFISYQILKKNIRPWNAKFSKLIPLEVYTLKGFHTFLTASYLLFLVSFKFLSINFSKFLARQVGYEALYVVFFSISFFICFTARPKRCSGYGPQTRSFTQTWFTPKIKFSSNPVLSF